MPPRISDPKVRETFAAQIQTTEFLLGAHPRLDAVRAELLRAEADWYGTHPGKTMVFVLEGASLTAFPVVASLIFDGDPVESLALFAHTMEHAPPPFLMAEQQVFDGFAMLHSTQARIAGRAALTFLHLVTVNGYSWTVMRLAEMEPLVFVEHRRDATGEIPILLNRAVDGTLKKLAANEAHPAVRALRAKDRERKTQ